MKKNKRLVNRYFTAILYEDDPNFKTYFNNIMNNYYYVTWITHDKDLDENGENKKKHIHILWKVGENARSIKQVSKEIGLAENYIQGCNKDAILRYLIHLDNPEKTQYNVDSVQGEGKQRIKEIVEDYNTPTESRISKILNNIRKGNIKTITDLIQYAVETNSIKQIKQMQYLLSKAIDENRNLNLKGHKF